MTVGLEDREAVHDDSIGRPLSHSGQAFARGVRRGAHDSIRALIRGWRDGRS
jgi:hypothetical protein